MMGVVYINMTYYASFPAPAKKKANKHTQCLYHPVWNKIILDAMLPVLPQLHSFCLQMIMQKVEPEKAWELGKLFQVAVVNYE